MAVMNGRPQSGNALWFILVAIVLLGALTMFLTRSGNSVTQSGDIEQLRVTASQILRYAKGLETAIDQMKMRGVSESDISFEHGTPATYVNSKCANSDCMVFGTGGGQSYKPAPVAATPIDWVFTGANNVGNTTRPVGTTAAGTGNDLLMMVEGISEPLCIQINRDLKVGTPGILPANDAPDLTPFDGSYDDTSLTLIEGESPGYALNGVRGGCFKTPSSNPGVDPDKIYFYYVLLAR